ncbi:DNA recombination and repair protein RecF [Lunatimonas lonarensis]|uniref:DNA replication and repair protein RecF n=1 Tax=Lunatimonas lonarensis TaxID=1232681 RepID=R7ZN99_9BACT|nr:DNA replication/repair protein RecF [Lunatimonas lonarensis]EON75552.1 DNA recombination and repair protein RecF [Lunatimonas lonarensis]
MYLKNIRLHQFKNYQEEKMVFSPDINCVTGLNGAGKTNLLDAIHYLCLTRSAFSAVDLNQVNHDADFFFLQGSFIAKDRTQEVKCVFERGKKKQVVVDGKVHEKMSDHIGLFPVVLIAPDDTALIRGGSEERRRFFDSILSQLDKTYLQDLIRYQHALKQRNALLKYFHENHRKDALLMEPYDREITRLSRSIHERRREFLSEFTPELLRQYRELVGKSESVSIHYRSDLEDPAFENCFASYLDRDIQLKRTQYGIHKDDFVFEIDGYALKKFGSQGQQKSMILGLKLSQFQLVKKHKKQTPILLLDDIFDKLDDKRIAQLMRMVADQGFGQLFITDARPERSRTILADLGLSSSIISIEQGRMHTTPPLP